MQDPLTALTTLGALARRGVADVATCLRFFSRLPVPPATQGDRPVARAAGMLPVAGLAIGCVGAACLIVADRIGLPPAAAALLSVAALVAATGALHEDGLADTADGFGGGATRERKLAIMRDSRIGTYGVVALVLALGVRVAALAALLDRDGLGAGVAAILAAAAVSRALALLPMLSLPPARPDGLGRTAGRPSRTGVRLLYGIAAVCGLLMPLAGGFDLGHAALASGLAALASLGLVTLARRHIGGHTGDVGGASQQVAEIAFLLGLLAFPGP